MRLFGQGILDCGGRAERRHRFGCMVRSTKGTLSGVSNGEAKAVSALRSATAVHTGFTVIELILVIAIIAALTAISLPAIKGITQSHTVSSASQQLMDDLALARQFAINNRSVVHVLFVPGDITNNWTFTAAPDLANRLKAGAFTTYAIYAERTVGDQPGQAHARYLSKWKKLPDGVFIPPREFVQVKFRDWDRQAALGRPLLWDTAADFPFPTLANQTPRRKLPHIAFGPHGGLLIENPAGQRQAPRDEIIELARGSILAKHNDTTGALDYFDVRESPPNNSVDNYNRIRIDGLTGRCTLERPELQ